MQRRTHAAICLGPTGNLQGSYKFLCLSTGKKLTRRNFTVIPGVPQTIISAVTRIAVRENRPTGLTFRNRHQEDFNFSNADLDEVLIEQHAAPFPDIPNELPGVTTALAVTPLPSEQNRDDTARQAAHNADINLHNVPIIPDDDDAFPPLAPPHIPAQAPNAALIISDDDQDTASTDDDDDVDVPTDESSSDDDNDDDDDDEPPDESRPTRRNAGRNSRYNDYHLFTTAAEDEFLIDDDQMATVCHFLMLHYSDPIRRQQVTRKKGKKANVFSLNAGLKRFGERGETAVAKELNQFNLLDTFTPLDPATLTYEQRRHALASLIFLTEKRNGDIKARACANGKPQREHVAKDETTSPTVTNEANFALAAIAAHERRYVATMDLPGAFLHATNDSFVVMKMTGKLAELMV